MNRDIFHIRDLFMRSFLSDLDMGKEFVRTFYPSEITRLLDFSTFKPLSDSFVSEKLKSTRADIIFECRTTEKYGNRTFNLCFLIEHKASSYRYASIQIGGYIFDAYRQQIKEGISPLTPVIPLIYYHGQKDWNPLSVDEIFEEIPSSVEPYIPSFEWLFENIGHYSDEEIWQMGSALFTSALMVQKYTDQPKALVERFTQIFSILESWSDRNLFGSLIVYYIEMIAAEDVLFEDLIEKLPEKMKTEFLSLADQLRNEGKAEGKAEGEKETLHKMILNMLQQGLSIDLISDVAQVSPEYVRRIRDQQ